MEIKNCKKVIVEERAVRKLQKGIRKDARKYRMMK
jgi:hypothetical protein